MVSRYRIVVGCFLLGWLCWGDAARAQDARPFGDQFPQLDSMAVGRWWEQPERRNNANKNKSKKARRPKRFIDMRPPRDQVVAFAVYTHDRGVLKLTAQLYPLLPDESRVASLEFQQPNGQWRRVARQPVLYPGWSAHFRVRWKNERDTPYRVRHGAKSVFQGLIRKDPIDKKEIVVGLLSCNSSRTAGPRPQIIANLQHVDPDLLFFAGDQTYHHTQHTAGWIQFGLQFREVLKDRPVVTIPDDHDVGQPNLWGEYGKVSTLSGASDGGYTYPVEYVNMVERAQTWHLPDPATEKPLPRGIGAYYTRLRVGGVDFAILEDRKFKSGPAGKIPKMGPRPDHINDPSYDRNAIDLEGLKLLGDEQLEFLDQWTQDWTGATMKCVLSQTAFCGAVHLHGSPKNRLLADLDCNGWPQSGRNRALRVIRRAWAPHLCGDQHLAVVVQHGIDADADGPYAFTSPAIVNTIYGRWWSPENGQPGDDPVAGGLPWTGAYRDGLGNRIRMLAYANPKDRSDERQRADGFGVVRFQKDTREVTFECWGRYANIANGDSQFEGWPVRFSMRDNDGRTATHHLPEVRLQRADQVVQVQRDSDGEILYTIRISGKRFSPPVYSAGEYTIRVGPNTPNRVYAESVQAVEGAP